MVGSRAHAAIKLHDHRGRKWHKARNPPAVSVWFPNFKISWEIIGGKYIVRVSSVLFCNFPPSLLWVQGTLLNCYPKISSLAASLTSRKTLFSNFVKGSFPLGLRKWNQRRLHCLAFNFFPASQQECDPDLEHVKCYTCLHLALSLVQYWGEIQLWWFRNMSTQMVRTTLAVWGPG